MSSSASKELIAAITRFLTRGSTLEELQEHALKQIVHLDPLRDAEARGRAARVALYIAEYGRRHRELDELRTLLAPLAVETPVSPFRSTASTVVAELPLGEPSLQVTRTRFRVVQGPPLPPGTRSLAVCA